MANLNLVEAIVKVDGQPVYVNDLILIQKFNDHHSFTIKVDYKSLEKEWMTSVPALFSKLGKDVNMTIQHIEGNDPIMFVGMITNVYFAGQLVKENYIVIEGKSKTILLDGEKTMYSFLDHTIADIANKSIDDSGNGASVIVDPKFSSKIEYFCQHNENCFEFLNRLSWLYGEWFYTDGIDIYFGKPDVDDSKEVTHDIEMNEVELGASIKSLNYSGLFVLNHKSTSDNKSEELVIETPKVPVAGNHSVPKGISVETFPFKGIVPNDSLLTTADDLEHLIKVQKARKVSSLHCLSGKTKTSKIKIGDIITFKLPANFKGDKSLGSFLITEVEHHYMEPKRYVNSFKAIPSSMEVIPMDEPNMPKVFPQLALVKDNKDDKNKGRVKVQFQWQRELNQETDWLRVVSPDAGEGDSKLKNRGYVAIPEIGDQVVVCFEDGNPNRPYVAGSLFQESIGQGGGDKNSKKSITTRTGSRITFDEDKGSITISDKTGADTITIDGENKISIATTKTISLTNGKAMFIMEEDSIGLSAKEIVINGSETLGLISGDEGLSLSGKNSTTNLEGTSVKVEGGSSTDIEGPAVSVGTGTSTVDVTGTIIKLNA